MNTRDLCKKLILGVIGAAGVLGAGCGTVTDIVYLQNVEVSGPVIHPPVTINDNAGEGEFRVSPRISLGTQQTIRGHVAGPEKYVTRYDNLAWNVPDASFAFDADLTVSEKVALGFGMTMSGRGGENYGGGHAGLGILFAGDDVAGRFDLGIHLQSLGYDAATVVERHSVFLFVSSSDTFYFHDRGTALLVDYYLSLTVNSTSHRGPVNFFGQLALSRQSLTNFYPHTVVDPLSGAILGLTYINVDTRASSSATFLSLTPGLFFRLGNSTRLVLGVHLSKELEIIGASPDVLVTPMVKFDIGL